MPPKVKFKAEQVIAAALKLVQREGQSALTARNLAKELNASLCPIFTNFKNMDEVAQKTELAARELYNGYIREALNSSMPFKSVGAKYIQFAIDEPKLFQLLFMSENIKAPDCNHVLNLLDDSYKQIIACVQNEYALSQEAATKLYLQLFLFTHGIATLIATGVCTFSGAEISQMLTVCFKGVLKEIKAEEQA